MIYDNENENENEDSEINSSSLRAERRKNDWKHAKRHAQILVDQDYELNKPLHYYSKTRPEFYYQRKNKTNNKGKHRTAYGNYYKSKNWPVNDKRKIENGKIQLEELYEENT